MSRPGFGAHTLSFSKDHLDRIARSLDHPEAEHLSPGSGQLVTCAPAALAELGRECDRVFLSVAAEPSILSTADFRSAIRCGDPFSATASDQKGSGAWTEVVIPGSDPGGSKRRGHDRQELG